MKILGFTMAELLKFQIQHLTWRFLQARTAKGTYIHVHTWKGGFDISF